jgi:hypothetical protein
MASLSEAFSLVKYYSYNEYDSVYWSTRAFNVGEKRNKIILFGKLADFPIFYFDSDSVDVDSVPSS